MKKSLYLALITVILFNCEVLAENTKAQIIYLKDGSSLTGEIIKKEETYIKVKYGNNQYIIIPVSKIDSISEELEKIEIYSEGFNQTEDLSQINKNKYSEEKILTPEINLLEEEKKKTEKIRKEMKKVIRLEDNITDNKNKIENLKTVRKEDWFPNPNYTRMFFAPTAKPLKKGEGYLQNINIFGFAGNYGINDNISIGGLGSLIPLIPANEQILAFTPKFGFNVNKDLSVGGGLLYLTGAGIAQVGVGYGVATFGSSDSNLTLGGGLAYGNISKGKMFSNIGQQEMVSGSGALIGMVGGMHRIGEGVSIVSENWAIKNNISNDASYLFAYGLRLFGKSSSWDFGVVYPLIPNTTTYPLPYIDYVWHF